MFATAKHFGKQSMEYQLSNETGIWIDPLNVTVTTSNQPHIRYFLRVKVAMRLPSLVENLHRDYHARIHIQSLIHRPVTAVSEKPAHTNCRDFEKRPTPT